MPVIFKDEFSLGTDPGGNPIPIAGTAYTKEGLFAVLSVVLRNVFVIAGIILFIFIVVGGLGMILNAGNAEKLKNSSKTLSSAVIGFSILFSSFWVIRIIEFLTGINLIQGL